MSIRKKVYEKNLKSIRFTTVDVSRYNLIEYRNRSQSHRSVYETIGNNTMKYIIRNTRLYHFIIFTGYNFLALKIIFFKI